MRRCLALARDYAHAAARSARTLIEQPLHVATLASMHAEFAGRVPARLLRRRAARPHRARHGAATTTARCCACSRRWPSCGPASSPCASHRKPARHSAAPATSRTPACRCCCATRRCIRSGKARPTCWRSICCARWRNPASQPLRAAIEQLLARRADAARPRSTRRSTRPRAGSTSRADERDALEAGARGLASRWRARSPRRCWRAMRPGPSARTATRSARAALALFLDHGLSRLSGDTATGGEMLLAGARPNGERHSPR